MRMRLAALSLAGSLACGAGLAATPSGAPPAGQPGAAAPSPVLGFYPAAAKAAGVEGQAVIRCARNAHMALKGCTLVSETPAGQGFGAAALAMAAQSPDNPKVDIADSPAKPPEDITVRFGLHPPAIAPDISRTPHWVEQPKIVAQPTTAQIQAAYPERALADQVSGAAAIDCAVTTDGKLTDCRVAGEQPSGYGFGQATLDLAGDFVMKPRRIDGDAIAGALVRVGVRFVPGDPAAPLTLDLKPKP
jgi:TonB family protein